MLFSIPAAEPKGATVATNTLDLGLLYLKFTNISQGWNPVYILSKVLLL